MTERCRLSRRRALALSGAALSGAVAGCTGSSNDETDEGDENDWTQPLEPSDWEGVDEIRLEAYTNGWLGVDPDPIAGVKNPALLLFAGERYEITWENRDGLSHNIAIRDGGSSRAVVGGHRTNTMKERGGTQSLSFRAAAEMHEYVCEPHFRSMIGYVHVRE